MRYLLLFLCTFPTLCQAQIPAPTALPPPDWKSLYEQANAATRAWKERAEALEAQNGELKDRLMVATDKLRNDPVRAAAEERSRQQSLAAARARSAPPLIITGKVLSITSVGILVSTKEETAATPDKLCFIEVASPSSYVDGQGVFMRAAAMAEPYEYKSVNGASRRVPRFCPLPGSPTGL